MIILLVLLPALALSTESLIDWKTCSFNENKCYCQSDREIGKNMSYINVIRYSYYHTYEEAKMRCDKFGIQHRYFKENHVLFKAQVKVEEGESLGDNPTLEFYNGRELLFGCKLENGQVKLVEKPENKDFVKQKEISLFEDRSIMKAPMVICAIQSKQAKKISEELENTNAIVKLSWKREEDKYLVPEESRRYFRQQKDALIRCDPYSFEDLRTSKDYIVHSVRNRDADILNCDNYNIDKDLFTMRYQKIDHPDEDYEIKELKCLARNGEYGDYYYVPGIIDPTDETKIVNMKELMVPQSYYVYCAAHVDELCEPPIKGCTDTETTSCPEYIPGQKVKSGEERKPATLTCPDGKWLINKQYYELEVSCMKNFLGDSNTAIFFAKHPSGWKIPVPQDAVCFQKYDCKLKSKLDLPKEEKSFIDSLVDDSNGILKCKNTDRTLAIYLPEKDEAINKSQSYSCNPETGSWENGMEIVPSKSIVRCIDVNAWPKLKQKLNIS